MLTAKTENGLRISMGEQWQIDELKHLRKATSFYCPACGSQVQLKLGTKKQWHFAHEKDKICDVQLEAESPYHLKGKYQLYQWLNNQQVKVALEVYLPLIRQRPDLLFKYQQKLFAVEFQCSPLDPMILEKRTKGYYQIGVTPLWILGGNRLKRHGMFTFTIKSFEWLTVRHLPSVEKQLIYYCPESLKWTTLQQITPYSTTKSLARMNEQPLLKMNVPQILNPTASSSLPIEQWLTLKNHWRYGPKKLYPSKAYRYFQQLLYRHQVSISAFPVEAGWATPFHDSIETSPHLWQTTLLFDCIIHQPLQQQFSIQLVYNWFRRFLTKKVFVAREFFYPTSYEQAVLAYVQWLTTIGLLSYSADRNYFFRERDPIIPRTQEEARIQEQMLANLL